MYKFFVKELTDLVEKKTEIEVVFCSENGNHYSQMKQWCHTEFGRDRTFNREGRWYIGAGWSNNDVNYYAVRFYNAEDAMAFKLRWA